MISQTIKGLIQRLFTDGEFRETFIKAPEKALAGLRVSAEENRALHRLHRRMVVASGSAALLEGETYWP